MRATGSLAGRGAAAAVGAVLLAVPLFLTGGWGSTRSTS